MIIHNMPKEIHEKLVEIAGQYGLPQDALRPMEFFFYAANEDAAAKLSIKLHELGYTLYDNIGERPSDLPLCISGHTPMMSNNSAVLAKWYEEMSRLAEANACFFDGYGSLIDEPEEGWDAIM